MFSMAAIATLIVATGVSSVFLSLDHQENVASARAAGVTAFLGGAHLNR